MRLTLILTVALLAFAACSEDATTSLDQPPAATASSEAGSVALGLGSYCWKSGDVGLCADSPGIVTGTVALAQTEFAVGDALIRPIEGEAGARGDDWRMWTPTSAAWPGEWSALELEAVDGGLRLVTELPVGRYLVSLFLSFPQGDALYGLILDIR
jgi:hypothetical protein